MDVTSLFLELYDRVPELARRAVHGLDLDDLMRPPAPGANTICWLVWHMARVEDSQVPVLFGQDQEWVTRDWGPRFGVASDPGNSGYGHTADEVTAVRPADASVLLEYLDAVCSRTAGLLGGLSPADLDRVIDESWDPPVTVGVRLASVAEDCFQHAGQAAYIRGLLKLD